MITADAKRALSKTIRSLREWLLLDLHAATESAYHLSVRLRDADLPEARRVLLVGLTLNRRSIHLAVLRKAYILRLGRGQKQTSK